MYAFTLGKGGKALERGTIYCKAGKTFWKYGDNIIGDSPSSCMVSPSSKHWSKTFLLYITAYIEHVEYDYRAWFCSKMKFINNSFKRNKKWVFKLPIQYIFVPGESKRNLCRKVFNVIAFNLRSFCPYFLKNILSSIFCSFFTAFFYSKHLSSIFFFFQHSSNINILSSFTIIVLYCSSFSVIFVQRAARLHCCAPVFIAFRSAVNRHQQLYICSSYISSISWI